MYDVAYGINFDLITILLMLLSAVIHDVDNPGIGNNIQLGPSQFWGVIIIIIFRSRLASQDTTGPQALHRILLISYWTSNSGNCTGRRKMRRTL
jgi:hypothetical protein